MVLVVSIVCATKSETHELVHMVLVVIVVFSKCSNNYDDNDS